MTDPDDRQLADAALEQWSGRAVRFICAYCEREIDEDAACCGERQAIPMPDEYLDL